MQSMLAIRIRKLGEIINGSFTLIELLFTDSQIIEVKMCDCEGSFIKTHVVNMIVNTGRNSILQWHYPFVLFDMSMYQRN